jgi:adsorption protein B
VSDALSILRGAVDGCVLACLLPLALYILLSGIDDLFIDAVWLIGTIREKLRGTGRIAAPGEAELSSAPEKNIAIFVPLWRENAVIGDMLAHNIAAIRYRNYTILAGAYPNDPDTVAAVRECEARYPNVHLVLCPHDGPTSKADCLNWIYRRMLDYESQTGARFDFVVTHDAEDMIHPASLAHINYFGGVFDFVQVPVLPLKTPWTGWTHGVYCDEFAEFQTRDLVVRQALGGFIPSAGVGTGYSRRALEALAATGSGQVFEPACLTEDYENGYRLHELGFRQVFLPLRASGSPASMVVTREYFPQTLRAAIRQRTRWITGIALQTWHRHGWRGSFRQKYWFWRDRRALIGNPASLLANVICAYALGSSLWQRAHPSTLTQSLMAVTLGMQIVRSALRALYVARLYGIPTALMTPFRNLVANIINATAACRAIWQFSRAISRGAALPWLKTEHAYPGREMLIGARRRLGDILIAAGFVREADLLSALATQPAGVRIGEHMIRSGLLTETELYLALSIQQGMPVAGVETACAPASTIRALPAGIARTWKVVPFRIADGEIHLATPEPPAAALTALLREYTSLQIRFHLITPTAFRELGRAVGASGD